MATDSLITLDGDARNKGVPLFCLYVSRVLFVVVCAWFCFDVFCLYGCFVLLLLCLFVFDVSSLMGSWARTLRGAG